ncbi:MAG: T9SS type A sorting domain-containing protein, partial [Bacteroidia bacterium]|nr:T9SS type A sorting domain-containing protein [Bacteroidia bacterium]
FNRAGTINFNRTASGHSISQVKQVVETGTTLDVIAGNVQLASHPTVGTDYFTVNSGATLKLRAGQVYSNGIYTNSGINVQNGGTISTMNLFGLYDGTNFAAIKAASNMNYYLAGNSTVEYNGWSNQIITGTGAGIATTDNHKYGILNINFNGTPDLNYLYPTSSNVFVRTALTLNIGELFLNGYTLTVENGSTVAIARTTGYIKSESSQANNSSYVKWKNMTSGTHEFPFGKRTSIYIPVFFSPVTGMGGDVMISTRSTLSDNQPYALMPSSLSAVSMSGLDPTENVIDRWWDFTATGFTANVTLSYPAEENTLLSTLKSGALSINKWSDQSWESYSNAGTGVTTGIGTVTIPSASVFTSWMVSTQNAAPLPVSLLDFTATPSGKDVILKWTTAIEVNNDFYTLEKSQDGTTFSSLAKVKGNGNSNSILNYRHADTNPKEGITFYRLKQTDFDGTTVNLKTVSINLGNIYSSHNLSIESVFPNPFSSSFTLLFNSSTKQNTEVKVTDMNGKMIHAESLMCEEGRNSFKYSNFEEIPKGIYFINLTAGGKALTQKIVKN